MNRQASTSIQKEKRKGRKETIREGARGQDEEEAKDQTRNWQVVQGRN